MKKIKRLELPGGTSVETFPEVLEEAKDLSNKFKEEKRPIEEKKHPAIPLTEANARMLNLGLAPSPSGLELSHYRILAEQDPNLALAGLRIETEAMLKNVAKGFKVSISERDGAGIISQKLRERGAITPYQYELINSILKLCNAAVHGQKVTLMQAEEILNIFEVLRDYYISWLSWGFNDDWKPFSEKGSIN